MLNDESIKTADSGAATSASNAKRGEKRPLSEDKPKPKIVRALPITEKQLKVLKNRATEVLNRLEEVLDLDFADEVERRYFSSFKAARGDIIQFLNCAVVGEEEPRQPNARQQPRRRMPRRVANENRASTWPRNERKATWVSLAAESRRKNQDRSTRIANSWGRPVSNGWPRDKEFGRQDRERSVGFNSQNRRPWASNPYPRQDSRSSFPRDGGNSSHFLRGDGGFKNSVSRNDVPRSRFNALDSNAQGSMGLNTTRPTARRKRRRSVSSSTNNNVSLRCELCDVVVGGQASYDQHMAGKRHRAALNARLLGSVPENREAGRNTRGNNFW